MKNEFLEGLEEKLEKDHKELEERTQEILRQIVSVRKISVAIPVCAAVTILNADF